jgi:hypothetical protein
MDPVNFVVADRIFFCSTNLKKIWIILLYAQPFFCGNYLFIVYHMKEIY